jgi:hypothetical protein
VKPISVLVGTLLAISGSVFFLQGIGVVHGSTMTGETTWAIVGPVLALVGLGLVVVGLRKGTTAADPER